MTGSNLKVMEDVQKEVEEEVPLVPIENIPPKKEIKEEMNEKPKKSDSSVKQGSIMAFFKKK